MSNIALQNRSQLGLDLSVVAEERPEERESEERESEERESESSNSLRSENEKDVPQILDAKNRRPRIQVKQDETKSTHQTDLSAQML